MNDGAAQRFHLGEIASHGYVVVASGDILTGPAARADAPAAAMWTTNVAEMRQSLDWALAENARRGSRYFGRIDPNMVAVSGYSCGGMLAIQLAADPRVRAIILHSSGIFPNRPNRPVVVERSMLDQVRLPFLYVIGNESDGAWEPATDDFSYISQTPVMLASLRAVAHEGTFEQPHGGVASRVAVDWLAWRLRGDAEAARTFIGPDCRLCADTAWLVRRKKM
jgi:hypothetical protein